MKILVILLIVSSLFCGCGGRAQAAEIFSKQWKSTKIEERANLVDLVKMYGLFAGKTKRDVELLLGTPDRIDQFGDYIYSMGMTKVDGHSFEQTCVMAFDGGGMVKRVEVSGL